MARRLDRRKAITLREQGETYNYIRNKLKVSKGTLSYWLKDIKLTKNQLKKIEENSRTRRTEKYLNTVHERRNNLFKSYLAEEKNDLLPINERDFLIAGLFLYLGEGGKSTWWDISISNTNPVIIKFAIFWLTKILKVPKNKIKIRLHLYKNMNIEKEIGFWKKITRISRSKFGKPYIKNTSSQKINYNTFGHGTCNVIVNDTKLKNKIMAGLRVLLEESKSYINSKYSAITPNSVI